MRFMIRFGMPTEKVNAAIKDGTFSQTVQSLLEELQPEAAYFTVVDGARCGIFILTWMTLTSLPPWPNPFSSD